MKRKKILFAIIICTSLISIKRGIAQTNENEPNDNMATANYLIHDTVMHGAICPGSDYDFYEIVLPSDGTLKIYFAVNQPTGSTGVGLNVTIFDKAGGNVNGYSIGAGTGTTYLNDTVVLSCASADTFYIRLYASTATSNCQNYNFYYSVNAQVFATDMEPNNDMTHATFFAAGTSTQGHLGYYASAPNDYYKLYKVDSGNLVIYVQATHEASDTTDQMDISAFTKAGSYLGGNWVKIGANNVIAFDTVVFAATIPDSFYLRTDYYTGCGSYKLSYKKDTTIDTLSGVYNYNNISMNTIVSPNPSSGLFKLQFENIHPLRIQVFNMDGRIILSKEFAKDENIYLLNLGNYSQGFYYAKITNDSGYSGAVRLAILR
jgi:hypothetical protein